MSELKVNAIVDANSGNTAQINGMTPTADSLQGFRNRLINSDMRIDQRNAGAAVTIGAATPTYTLDRWTAYSTAASKFTVQQTPSATETGFAARVGAGFRNYLAVTSLAATTPAATDEYILQQRIEGFNAADLAWGTSDAKTITLSFLVYSSLTGTFGGAIQNSASNRVYVFSYSIPTANTWTSISVTIAGDTSGTWLTTNGIGIRVGFDLGSGATYKGTAGSWGSTFFNGVTGGVNVIGTSGATFFITGVQLEAGSVATPFERIDYGRQLIQCQRYFQSFGGDYAFQRFGNGLNTSTTVNTAIVQLMVSMRANPTLGFSSVSDFKVIHSGTTLTDVTAIAIDGATTVAPTVGFTVASGLTSGAYGQPLAGNTAAARLTFSSEL
jgi:hypothetical protein